MSKSKSASKEVKKPKNAFKKAIAKKPMSKKALGMLGLI